MPPRAMPIAWAPTAGRVDSKVAIAACELVRFPSRARAMRSSSFSLPPRRHRPGTRHSSNMTSPVCEARIPIFLNLVPAETPGVPSGTTKLACPREPSSGTTDATTTLV